MTGNSDKGKKTALAIGVYVIVKAVINGLIGGFSLADIAVAFAMCGVLVAGVKFCNYVVAAILAFVVLKNLGHNLSDISANFIYLTEAAADIVSAAILVFSKDIKSYIKQ